MKNLPNSYQTESIPTLTTSKSPTILPAFRSRYSGQIRYQLSFKPPGRTKQSFKDECDINRIMARYATTGSLDFINQREARYLDVDGADYQAAMDLVAGARSMFESLPSNVRARFDNDPAQLLDFLEKPYNRQEAIDLGLVVPTPPPKPTDAVAAVLEPSTPPLSSSPAPKA
ncbi:MAG: internal scaffolding protein [Microviridae sp.]|nr:MAG: internal scaffolding protein [Microviridae sp.]